MRRPATLVLSAVLLLGACADEETPTIDTSGSPAAATTTSPSTSAPSRSAMAVAADAADVADILVDGAVTLSTSLSGGAAYPGPGDDGQGSFAGTLAMVDEDGRDVVELCYDLEVDGLSMPVEAAHVHRGAAGEAGEVVVPLATPRDGSASGCVEVRAGDAALVLTNPSTFYVNVHTDDYPDGAVRGQLARGG